MKTPGFLPEPLTAEPRDAKHPQVLHIESKG